MEKSDKKPTVKSLQEQVNTLTRQIQLMDNALNSFNTAIVALAYVVNPKGSELDKVTPDEYVKFVEEHVHPLTKRSDEIIKERIEQMMKEENEK